MRLFLAVEAPASEMYGRVTAELQALHPRVRAVAPGSWHATLRFLGDVADPQRIVAAARPAVAAARSVPLRVEGLGAFPSPRKARVLWAGMHADGLAQLAASLRQALPLARDPEAGREFHGHVTLARLDPPRDVSALVAAHAETRFADGMLREVGLFHSVTTPKGPVYTKLAALPLGPA